VGGSGRKQEKTAHGAAYCCSGPDLLKVGRPDRAKVELADLGRARLDNAPPPCEGGKLLKVSVCAARGRRKERSQGLLCQQSPKQ